MFPYYNHKLSLSEKITWTMIFTSQLLTWPGFRQWIKQKRAEQFEVETQKPRPSSCLTSLLVPRMEMDGERMGFCEAGFPLRGLQKGWDATNGGFSLSLRCIVCVWRYFMLCFCRRISIVFMYNHIIIYIYIFINAHWNFACQYITYC